MGTMRSSRGSAGSGLERRLDEWLRQIATEGALPAKCRAIYIGLLEGQDGYTAHFLGSVDFDPNDDDWACEEDDDYFPANRYLKTGVPTSQPWEPFLDEVVAAIRKLRAQKAGILSKVAHVAVGFDGGDLLHI